MPTFFIDETGFTGEDLLSREQPLFVQATNDYSTEEASTLVREFFGRVQTSELKYKQLVRGGRYEDRIVECVAQLASDPKRVGVWLAHKEFALVTLIIEWWMEPLAYKAGHNLYQDGANHTTANLLYLCLEGFWNADFRYRLLLHFQRMFRSRLLARFKECEAFVTRERSRVDGDRAEIIRYLWPSFSLLGYEHVRNLPKHVLDLSLPGLAVIGHRWRSLHEGPWEAVYDDSSMMAKQAWLWEAMSSPQLASARFHGPDCEQIFPMNVTATRFARSEHEKQIQLCDILGGAAATSLRAYAEKRITPFAERLVAAGMEKLVIGGMWPSDDVTPEGVGKKGWDGSKAIDWLGAEVRRQRERQSK
jgi:hypothetical protein